MRGLGWIICFSSDAANRLTDIGSVLAVKRERSWNVQVKSGARTQQTHLRARPVAGVNSGFLGQAPALARAV